MQDVNRRSLPPRHRLRVAQAAIATLLAATVFSVSDARAQDASFGCKVLLCAAASAPGWTAIPYCVPVMQQLAWQLAHKGSWPVCPEAQSALPNSSPAPSNSAGGQPPLVAGSDGGN